MRITLSKTRDTVKILHGLTTAFLQPKSKLYTTLGKTTVQIKVV
ncbi:hypothetical protein PPHE_a0729 [Pseudoalteromonas phenolica O-BC30]|nr:hypothetical protein [Pseudoalteromonas phenolica O-BC30]